MAEMHFEEKCPCGASCNISGYSTYVNQQVSTWRSIHTRHMNAIAKSVAEGTKHPPYYIWPYNSTIGGSGVMNYTTQSSFTSPGGNIAEKKSE
jgi:hypothetical protein